MYLSFIRITGKTLSDGGIYICDTKNVSFSMHHRHYPKLLDCAHLNLLTSSSSDTFETFERKICDLLFNHSFIVKAKHVSTRYGITKSKSAYAAYVMLIWTLENIPNLNKDIIGGNNLWLEFGVASGYSMNLTTRIKSRLIHSVTKEDGKVYGFDSFYGLPTNWIVTERSSQPKAGLLIMKAHAFTRNGVLPPIDSNAVLIKGLFNETLDLFLTTHSSKKIGYVNIDNDLYEGAIYVLERVVKRLLDNAIIHFHDFLDHRLERHGFKNCVGLDEMRALYDVMLINPDLKLQLYPFYTSHRSAVVFRHVKILY